MIGTILLWAWIAVDTVWIAVLASRVVDLKDAIHRLTNEQRRRDMETAHSLQVLYERLGTAKRPPSPWDPAPGESLSMREQVAGWSPETASAMMPADQVLDFRNMGDPIDAAETRNQQENDRKEHQDRD